MPARDALLPDVLKKPVFAVGQRWVSNAEPALGLGLVIDVQLRVVRVLYPAVDEERAYSVQSAPLSRLVLEAGDTAKSAEGWSVTVDEVLHQGGFTVYVGQRSDTKEIIELPETRLAHDLRLDAPRERFRTFQFDDNRWFELRFQALRSQAQLESNDLRGLLGPRIAAVPHQLYIAHEVAHRHAPRVMLADEVGLGKTIEAGLILHHQFTTERAQRALIIVPPALLSQWVLELLRRFNLEAAIFDEERCLQAQQSSSDNPFLTAQIVLCDLEFLLAHPERAEQITAVDWDILVVDEAHHLRWSVDSDGVSPEYRLVEKLARTIPGLLLLTATPEQFGGSSHFARLRLLDPDRFSDLEHFEAEQATLKQTASEVDALMAQGRDQEVAELLDRHGTGRVLFRNSRAHIQGFGQRQLNTYALTNPYSCSSLHPELIEPEDWECCDPRVSWLADWLRQQDRKALVICAHQSTAMALATALQDDHGLGCAAFHEGMGMLARDRAAAGFASEDKVRALICSEIGSEGRNFQFVQDLVLFDLPDQPDLLEQRIGRLDRIGQQGVVQIHVPFLEGSQQHTLLRWYKDGLDAFEHFGQANSVLRTHFDAELQAALASPDQAQIEELIQATQNKRSELLQELEQGRDRLLELHSCKDDIAQSLANGLVEADRDAGLLRYLEQVCDGFGIDIDTKDAGSYVLRPAQNYEQGFKDISSDGTAFTQNRAMALAKEDHQFLSWEHPLITESFDRVMGSSRGNTALGVIRGTEVPPGTLMLECVYQVQVSAPRALQIGRYLPPRTFRVVIDHELGQRQAQLPFDLIRGHVRGLRLDRVKSALQQKQQVLENMLSTAEDLVQAKLPELMASAHNKVDEDLVKELERLKYLQSVNPNVRQVEIDHLESSIDEVRAAVDQASIGLAAIRILIAN
nr:RNA polymerase-associated protein RapA [Oceanococcus sp. HetDA_MAG_MS8]